ncbi:hypothetical protein AAC387_Pa06g2472 [Persea americana]
MLNSWILIDFLLIGFEGRGCFLLGFKCIDWFSPLWGEPMPTELEALFDYRGIQPVVSHTLMVQTMIPRATRSMRRP